MFKDVRNAHYKRRDQGKSMLQNFGSFSPKMVVKVACAARHVQTDVYYYYYDDGYDPDMPLPKQTSQRQKMKPEAHDILSSLKRRFRPTVGRYHRNQQPQKITRVMVSLLLFRCLWIGYQCYP